MYLNSIGTRLRSVTVGYGLRLHLFSFKINAVTVVTPLRGRACRRARAHAWRPKQKLSRTGIAPNERNERNLIDL